VPEVTATVPPEIAVAVIVSELSAILVVTSNDTLSAEIIFPNVRVTPC